MPTRPPWTERDSGKRILALARDQAGLVNRVQAHTAGMSDYQIRQLIRARLWQRATAGVYAVLPLPEKRTIDAHRLRAAWMGLLAVPDGIAVGASALALLDIWGLPRTISPEIALPGGAHVYGSSGVRVRRFSDFPTTTVNGRLVAAPAAALIQALPDLSREYAVAVVDSALNRRKINIRELALIERGLRGRRGAARVRPWLALVNGSAESPFETRVRLQCLDAGLPPPIVQAEVWDDDHDRVARGDLGWRRADGTWVLVDLDGREYHSSSAAVFSDRARQNAIALTGRHTHLRFTWADLRSGIIPLTIARALATR